MTDTPALSPESLATLDAMPAETRARAAGMLRQVGYRDVPEALSKLDKPTNGQPAPAAATVPGTVSQNQPLSREGITSAQEAQGIRNLIEKGSPEVAEAAHALAEARGVNPDSTPRQDAVTAILDGPTAGADLHLDYGSHANTIPDLAAFDASVRKTFVAIKMPALFAQPALDSWLGSQDTYPNGLTEEDGVTVSAENQLRFASEAQRLRNLSGVDANETARLANIGQASIKAANPALEAELYKSGAFHSAEGIISLSRLGAAVETRKGKAK